MVNNIPLPAKASMAGDSASKPAPKSKLNIGSATSAASNVESGTPLLSQNADTGQGFLRSQLKVKGPVLQEHRQRSDSKTHRNGGKGTANNTGGQMQPGEADKKEAPQVAQNSFKNAAAKR